jgi:hypothetical protein
MYTKTNFKLHKRLPDANYISTTSDTEDDEEEIIEN